MKQSNLKFCQRLISGLITSVLLTITLVLTVAAYAGPQNCEVEKTKPVKKPLTAADDFERAQRLFLDIAALALFGTPLAPAGAVYAGPQNCEVEKTKPIKKTLPAGVDSEGIQRRKIASSLPKTQEEAIYQRFLAGILVYRPDPNSDVGKVEFRISDFENPLGGTFNLSWCGDTWEYLSISTGYRKKSVFVNKSKVEIWIAPRFLIEGNLTGDASYFKPIMDNWDGRKVPVGLIFNWGGWNGSLGERHYDYLTTQSMDKLFNGENFYSKWCCANPTPSVVIHHSWRHTHVMEKISLKFPAKEN